MTTKTYQLPPRDWEDGYLAGMEDALHLLSSMGVASETIAALREKAKFKLPERKPKHIGYYGEILDRPGAPPYSLLPDFAKRQDIDLSMEGQLMYRWHRHVGVVGKIANDLDEMDIAARLEELQDYEQRYLPDRHSPLLTDPEAMLGAVTLERIQQAWIEGDPAPLLWAWMRLSGAQTIDIDWVETRLDHAQASDPPDPGPLTRWLQDMDFTSIQEVQWAAIRADKRGADAVNPQPGSELHRAITIAHIVGETLHLSSPITGNL